MAGSPDAQALRLSTYLLAALALAMQACGSSGSDDVIENDTIIILPLYAYQLTSTSDDPITITVPLWEAGFQELQLGHLFDGPGVFGTYQPDDGSFTVEAGSRCCPRSIPAVA